MFSGHKSIFIFLTALFYHTAIYGGPLAIVGGIDGSTQAYTAFVNPITNTAGPVIQNIPAVTISRIKSVWINNHGEVLISGVSSSATTPYAAFVDFATNTAGPAISNLPPPGGNHFLTNGQFNDPGQTIVGGRVAPVPYAAFVNKNTNTAGPTLNNLPTTNTRVSSVAINNSGKVLISGGRTGFGPGFAAFVNINTNTVGPLITNIPSISTAELSACAMNNSNQALIGGTNGTSAYAAFVDMNTNAAGPTILNIPTAAGSHIGSMLNFGTIPGNGVAINDFGKVIIGGFDGTAAYAAFVDIETNTAGPPILNIPTAPGSLINSVAINNIGQAMIGGQVGSAPYAAFVDMKTNTASNPILNLPSSGTIYSVALRPFSNVPSVGLANNNKIFARYITQFAPQDAFYFIPAFLNGVLPDALESAAPTRNAAPLFTADNNMFYLNQAFSLHLRNNRHYRNRTALIGSNTALSARPIPHRTKHETYEKNFTEHNFLHSSSICADNARFGAAKEDQNIASLGSWLSKSEDKTKSQLICPVYCYDRPYTLWFEAVGAFASQKSQSQTPGFDPSMGGAVLGFDGNLTSQSELGGGAAYTFTHIDDDNNAGSSRIHQEYLFIYGTFNGKNVYFNAALWGGYFQIDQKRNMDLDGFTFQAKSDRNGWQLSPHAELGANPDMQVDWFIFEPFVMVDWVNNWQESYKEKGNGPFNAAQDSHYSSFLRSEGGLRFYQIVTFEHWYLIFQEKGSYINKTPFDVGEFSGFLVGSPGSFTLETLTHTQNLGAVEVSLVFEPADDAYPYGSIGYQGEFSVPYQSHQIIGEISWDF